MSIEESIGAGAQNGENKMKEFKYILTDPEGVHARPAGELVKLAKQYTSAVTVGSGGKTADARKIFGVMSLGIKCGQEITITAQGEDEEAAIKAMEEFLIQSM